MSMVAAPRPIMIPVANRPRITLRAASSQMGPTCAATRKPRPKPVNSAVVMMGSLLITVGGSGVPAAGHYGAIVDHRLRVDQIQAVSAVIISDMDAIDREI